MTVRKPTINWDYLAYLYKKGMYPLGPPYTTAFINTQSYNGSKWTAGNREGGAALTFTALAPTEDWFLDRNIMQRDGFMVVTN